jgi:hypothetical protein
LGIEVGHIRKGTGGKEIRPDKTYAALDSALRISSQLQTISSIRIGFFESPTLFIRSMDKSLL